MAFMEWKNEYSVKVKQFDDQHQVLFRHIDDLYEAMSAGKGNSVMNKIINDLEIYTITHFRDEEKYLLQHNYPKLNVQKAEHKYFTDEIARFKKESELNKLGLPITVVNFLKDWLSNHIKIKDMEYSQFLANHG